MINEAHNMLQELVRFMKAFMFSGYTTVALLALSCTVGIIVAGIKSIAFGDLE